MLTLTKEQRTEVFRSWNELHVIKNRLSTLQSETNSELITHLQPIEKQLIEVMQELNEIANLSKS